MPLSGKGWRHFIQIPLLEMQVKDAVVAKQEKILLIFCAFSIENESLTC